MAEVDLSIGTFETDDAYSVDGYIVKRFYPKGELC